MKTFCKIFIGLLILFFAANNVSAQLITAEPEFPTASDSVTITFDASKGNQGLKDYDGDVYAHTGVITENSSNMGDWKYVVTEWGVANEDYKLEQVGENLYEYDIKPSIRQYYGVPDGEKIKKLAFVFRNGDGSKEAKTADGGDIFYDVGLNVNFIRPENDLHITAVGDTVIFKAKANAADSLVLYKEDNRLKKSLNDSISDSVIVSTETPYSFYVNAYYQEKSATDSLEIYVRGDINTASLPSDTLKDGVNYINDSTATLVLFAPHKEFVYLLGDFNNWELNEDYLMNKTPEGNRYWLTINELTPQTEYIFQYFVDGEVQVADPYTEQTSDPNDQYISSDTYPDLPAYPEGQAEGIASVLETGQEPYQWETRSFETEEKEDLVVYELWVKTFTEDGTIKSAMNKLDHLKNLGVDAIELMPVNEFEGNNSWGYNPSFYFAFDKAYGTKKDFKQFVDSCHKKGMAVVMDMVLNHSYNQSPLVQLYFDPGAGSYGHPTAENPWYNQQCPHQYCWGHDFDHHSQATKDFVDRLLTYWVREYNVDGYRLDFSNGFTNNSDEFGYEAERIELLKRMTDTMHSVDPDAYMIIEHWSNHEERKELANYGMMPWNNLNAPYNEATMGYHEDSKSDFSGISYKVLGYDQPTSMGYMESHDEERLMYKNLAFGNSGENYDITNLPTALERIELAANFFIPVPGPKMMWQFVEMGYDYSIFYDPSLDTIPEPYGNDQAKLEPKPVRWDYMDNPNRRRIYKVFSTLNRLKDEEAAFGSSDFSFRNPAKEVKELVIRHEDMDTYIMGNFGVSENSLTPEFPQGGTWYELYSGDTVDVANIGDIALQPGEYRFYSTKKLEGPQLSTAVEEVTSSGNARMQVYPNPVQGNARLSVTAKQASNVAVSLYNMQGKLMKQFSAEIQTGKNIIRLNSSELPDGVYVVSLKGDSIYSKTYLIKQ